MSEEERKIDLAFIYLIYSDILYKEYETLTAKNLHRLPCFFPCPVAQYRQQIILHRL